MLIKKNNLLSRSCISSLLISGVSLSTAYLPATVSHAESLAIEELIVSARKRAESIQDTPISMTAVSGDDMKMMGMQNISDVSRVSPNVSFAAGAGDGGGSFSSSVYIRGVGQSDFLITTDPGVGIYIDGVYFARSMGSIMDLIDFERIEILRGPQGTLFGKNTIGGAISITSGQPDYEFGGSVELGTGSRDRFDASAVLNVPIIDDKLLTRFSVLTKRADGYGHRVDFDTGAETGELGNTDTQAARAQILWMPTDTLEVNIAADTTRQRAESMVSGLVDVNPQAGLAMLWNTFVAPVHGLGPMDDRWVTNDPYRTYGTGDSGNDLDAWGVSASVAWELETMEVKSITAYRELEAFFTTDQDHSPLPYVQTTNDDEQEQFSQEFQLSGLHFDERFDWLVGAFYFHEEAVDENSVELAPGLFAALESLPAAVVPLAPVACPAPFPAPCAGGAGNPINIPLDLVIDAYNRIEIDSYAIFAQGTYEVTDGFSVTAGLRYTEEEKEYTLDHRRVASGVPVFPATTVSEDWNSLSPHFGMAYQVNNDILTYFSASKGFKSGGFNGRPITEAELGSFDPEYVWAYEIGFKSEWFDRRLIVNAAMYFTDYSDIQLNSVKTTPEGNLIAFTENAGEAEVKGFELEVTGRLAAGLDLNASLGQTDFEFVSLNEGVTVNTNSRPPHTPSWTSSIGLQYEVAFSGVGMFTLRGDYSRRSSTYTETANLDLMAQEGYGIFNAHLGFLSEDERWELALNGLNLGDEEYRTSGFSTIDSFGLTSVAWGSPRSWVFTTTYNF